MNSQPFRIAIFRSKTPLGPQAQALALDPRLSLRVILRVGELTEAEHEDGMAPELILIPPSLLTNAIPHQICAEIRALPGQETTPILALADTLHADLRMLEAGATAVASLDTPEILLNTCLSLARLHRRQLELLNSARSGQAPRESALRTFDILREALLLFTPDFRLTLVNRAARELFGVSSASDLLSLEGRISDLLHIDALDAQLFAAKPRFQNMLLSQLSGPAIHRQVCFADIPNDADTPAARAIIIAAPDHSNTRARLVDQAGRLRALTLFSLATCRRFLKQTFSALPVAPLSQIERLFAAEPRQCDLTEVLGFLLESADSLIDPGASVRLEPQPPVTVAVRASDLFQLVGAMLLLALEYAGAAGETVISCESQPDGCVVMIKTVGAGDIADEHPADISSMNAIAERYSADVQYKSKDEIFMIRVKLPLT